MNRREAIKAMGTVLYMPAMARIWNRTGTDIGRGNGIARGTINVILGNDNGIVALTDSMLSETLPTGQLRQLPAPGQKLFVLDSKSVCTVAGFIAADVPFPLAHTVSAILQGYRDLLASRAASFSPTLDEKLGQLAFTLQNDLSLLADIRNRRSEDRQWELQLTLAGYDPDGTPRIAWTTLSIDRSRSTPDEVWLVSVSASPQDSGDKVAKGKELTIKVRGISDVAEEIIAHPEHYTSDAAISRYRRSRDRGEALSTSEMKDFAVALARETAAHYPGVGGLNQVAILRRGSAIDLDQVAFPPEHLREGSFNIITDGYYGPLPEAIELPHSGVTNLVVHNEFRTVTVVLDSGYFASNSFDHCLVVYAGSTNTIFAPNQTVSSSILALGKNVDRNSETVSHLVKDFPWKRVVSLDEAKGLQPWLNGPEWTK